MTNENKTSGPNAMLTVTEAAKIELAFEDAKDMGDDFDTALDWAEDIMKEERGEDCQGSIAIWVVIRDLGEEVWSAR